MNVAIISDTHDNSAALVWIIEYLNHKQITTAFHAGDLINPGMLVRFIEHYQGHLHFIFGNNDGEQAIRERKAQAAKNLTSHGAEMRMELLGKRIFMNHYSSISESMAQTQEFDICIGGHDHLYRLVKHGKCLFINPGNTVTKDKWAVQPADKESSIVVLDLETVEYERVMLPDEFQSEVAQTNHSNEKRPSEEGRY